MNIFKIQLHQGIVIVAILGVSTVVLGLGNYKASDKIIKIVIIILAVSTVMAVVYAFSLGMFDTFSLSGNFDWANRIDILFLIAFMGWMPAPIDGSFWYSLWSTAKENKLGKILSMRQSLLNFNIGYIGAALLGVCFLQLWALVMFDTGEKLSANGIASAGQLTSMYTTSLGLDLSVDYHCYAYYYVQHYHYMPGCLPKSVAAIDGNTDSRNHEYE